MWPNCFKKYLASLLFLIVCLAMVVSCGGLEESTAPVEESAEPDLEETAPSVEPTSPSEESTEAEILSIEEALAEIDAQLKNTLRGSVAHSAPSNMQLDETAEVTLLVSPSLSEDDLASEITTDGEVKTTHINITPWMHAELISLGPKRLQHTGTPRRRPTATHQRGANRMDLVSYSPGRRGSKPHPNHFALSGGRRPGIMASG